MPSVIYKSFPVTEIGESGGDVTVLGKCSDGELDSDGDIIDPRFMAQAVKSWLRVCPSIYRDHSPGHPAGVGLDAWQDDTGATWLKSRIADEDSKALVLSGRLKSYSVGLHDVVTRKSARCPRFEIVGGRLTEVSIVGSPSNTRCGVRIIGKSAAGAPAYIGKAFGMAKKPGKIEKARQRFAGDPEGFYGWLAKRAEVEREKSLRAFAVSSLGSSDPMARELARRELGRYGLG